MKPLSDLEVPDLVGVLTDIDDTLTTDGRLGVAAFDALTRLSEAGLLVVPITGRSAGWAHMILKTWPVRAVIAESGGLYLARAPGTSRIVEHFYTSAAQAQADHLRLQQCASQILLQLPGLHAASDNPYRRVDLALDHSEEVTPVPQGQIDQAIALFHAAGFSARASSVHVNAWSGAFDKAAMALRCLREQFGAQGDPARWVFIGDAPNDESMFAQFVHSVAVANIVAHLPRLQHRPAYLTRAHSGDGFVEFVQQLLRSRPA